MSRSHVQWPFCHQIGLALSSRASTAPSSCRKRLMPWSDRISFKDALTMLKKCFVLDKAMAPVHKSRWLDGRRMPLEVVAVAFGT